LILPGFAFGVKILAGGINLLLQTGLFGELHSAKKEMERCVVFVSAACF